MLSSIRPTRAQLRGSQTVDYELIVIGGGAAGLSAARSGVRGGRRTLMVTDGPPGGDCTFTGCVPSKTLIESAAQGIDFPLAMARVKDAVSHIAGAEDAEVLRKEGIDVIDGRARFASPGSITVGDRVITGRRFVIATGTKAFVPPIPGLADVPYQTNETVFDIYSQPSALIVLGGGPIGCELAQAFARLGTKVTVIEGLPQLLPREEPEAATVITEVFRRADIDVRTGDKVVSASRIGSGVRVTLESGAVIEGDELLVAVGRAPITSDLGLDKAGVGLDAKGYIITDDLLATTRRGIYAAGDVTGRLAFTHAADEMGRIATTNALSRLGRAKFHAEWTPWVTFTDPEVAHVGLTEDQAVAVGGRVAFLPMTDVDRAITAGHTDGFVKLIFGPRRLLRHTAGGKVLGATIVAARAGEMIAEPALAIRTRMIAGRLAQTTHAYPTWSSAIQQAAAQFFFEIGGRRARPAAHQETKGSTS